MPDVDLTEAIPDATEEQRFRLLLEHSPDMVSLYDGEGRFSFASAAHSRILGYPVEELVGRDPLGLVHPDDVDHVVTGFAAQLAGTAPSTPLEFRFRRRDGRYLHLEAVVVDLTADPAVGGILVASRDVSDRKQAEATVQEQARVLERIARGAPIGQTLEELCALVEHRLPGARAVVFVRDGRAMRVAAAPSVGPELRAALDLVSGQPGIRVRLMDGPVSGAVGSIDGRPEIVGALGAAGIRAWLAAPIFASDGNSLLGTLTALMPEPCEPSSVETQVLAVVGSLAAIALERDDAQARLAHQASHDALTGLPNRDHLLARLREHTEQSGDGLVAVYFLDLDRFKVFNDSAGHDAGDRILVDVALRLRSALRDGDVVARFGGDEFVVVCGGLVDADEVIAVAERMLGVVSQPFEVDGMEFVVTASIGVSLLETGSPESLLRDADTAMYRAKELGRARIEVFDGELRARVVARLDTERDLRRALDSGGLVLHYQPVMSFRTGRFAGFEALVRWSHPTRGLLAPDEFLDVAEDAGLIARLGSIAQRMAFRQWVDWRGEHPEWGNFVIGVNLSAAELRDTSLPAQVASLIEETGADPRSVVFEASERVLGSDTESACAVLGELREMGVLLALDDFGTGSSPLLHLRRLPIDAVKLDGALVAGLGVNRDDNVLVSSMIALAHRLGLFAVAEGVENLGQAKRLQRYGCLLAQGHFFAPALPPAAAAEWATTYGLSGEIPGLPR